MALHDLVDGRLRCCTCHVYKELDEFHNSRSGKHGKAGRCKLCACSRARVQHTENRAKGASEHEAHRRAYRDAYYKRTYGITLAEFEQMLLAQNGACAICYRQIDPVGKQCHLDHCHSTGKLRGILCSSCNRGIGYLGDNIATVQNALQYLKEHNA